MKRVFYTTTLVITGVCAGLSSMAQRAERILPEGYDPDMNKIIPDKIFEFGIPLLIIYLLANTVINIFRINAERRLKEKALDRQISEATLVALFSEDRHMARYTYIKWVLVLSAAGISLLLLHFIAQFARIKSGYLSLGIIALFLAAAFLIYYNIIKKK